MTVWSDLQTIANNFASNDAALAKLLAGSPPPIGNRSYLVGTPPAPTPQEVAAGLTNTVLFDDFLDPSTVDFGWAFDPTKSIWMFQPWRWQTDELGSISNSIAVVNSCLNLTRDYLDYPDGGILCTLSSQGRPASPPSAPTPVPYLGPPVGVSFKGSQSVTYRVSCNPGGAEAFPPSWPAGWRMSRQQMLYGIGEDKGIAGVAPYSCSGPPQPQHIEIDDFEWMPAGMAPPYYPTSLFSVRHWLSTGTNPPCTWGWDVQKSTRAAATSQPGSEQTTLDLAAFNIVQTIYKSALDSVDGVGSLDWYVLAGGSSPLNNGQWLHLTDCGITWKTGDGSPWNLLDQLSFYLILGCGRGYPASFDYVCVRQLPGSNGVILN